MNMAKVITTSWGQTMIYVPKNEMARYMLERLKKVYKK